MVTVTRRKPSDRAIKRGLELVEKRRAAEHLSQREAGKRAGLSEATWRQLIAGGVYQRGEWINRIARRDQLLDMAAAVGNLHDVADVIDATPDEVEAAQTRVYVPDPAEEDILAIRHATTEEKLRLLDLLQQMREHNNGNGNGRRRK